MGRKNLYRSIFGMKRLHSVSDGSGARFIHLSMSCDIIIRKIDFQRKHHLEIVRYRKIITEKLQNTNGMMENRIYIHNLKRTNIKNDFTSSEKNLFHNMKSDRLNNE